MFMDSRSREAAAEALGKMGVDAKAAIPVFTNLLRNKPFLEARGNEVAVVAVRNALKKIKADVAAVESADKNLLNAQEAARKTASAVKLLSKGAYVASVLTNNPAINEISKFMDRLDKTAGELEKYTDEIVYLANKQKAEADAEK